MAHKHPTAKARKQPQQLGFALIATLSIMALLVMVGLGMMTLSVTTLRSSKHSATQATAQANARMALMVALGELQKHAGPDQRITARANLLNESSPNGQLTGVWNSLQLDQSNLPSPALYEQSYRKSKFRSWLVSTANDGDDSDITLADTPFSNPIQLWGKGSLGKASSPQQHVSADKVNLENNGTYAWAIMDEGTKVRVNTHYTDNANTTADKIAQLGAGERPRTSLITNLDGLTDSIFQEGSTEYLELTAKGITANNFDLSVENISLPETDTIKGLTHDISISSQGLFTDVANGGLKQDFHILSNASSLPSSLLNSGPYLTHLDLGYPPSDVLSNPRWESFYEYANLYKNEVTNTGGIPKITPKAPTGWNASTPIKLNTGQLGSKPYYDYVDTTPIEVLRTPPPGLVLTPSIARVQLVFALIARDIWKYPVGGDVPFTEITRHDKNWTDEEKKQKKILNDWAYFFRRVPPIASLQVDYLMNLMITPILTLHNPYNVAMECSDLRINFIRTPFALKVYRDGEPMSSDFVPIDMMYGQRRDDPQCNPDGDKRKIFGLNLKGSETSDSFTLLPGEVKVFSPYLEPTGEWKGDSGKTTDVWMKNARTHNIDCLPGWPGDGLGYSSTRILGKYMRTDLDEKDGVTAAGFGISKESEIHVEFAPRGVDLAALEGDSLYDIDPDNYNKFTLQMEMGTQVVNTIQIDYEQPAGLQDTLLGEDESVRWPAVGTVPGSELHDHHTTPISDLENVQPFALFSFQGKSTHGAIDSSGDDGRYATKPFTFGHSLASSSVYKAVSEHTANASHEINLVKIPYQQGTESVLDIDVNHRTNYLSGHTSQFGTKFGISYEIPLAPIQTLAQLNSANPGGASGYLPRFAQPIGNSWAHPMMAPDQVSENSADGSYKLLDHSYLLNAALYDQFYFSGFADSGSTFGSGKSAGDVMVDFSKGEPLTDPRMTLNVPSDRSASDLETLASGINSDLTAYQQAASWQTMKGAFNVNSTSVEAWKAMLGSIHDSQAIVNQIDKANGTTSLVALTSEKQDEVRFSRFRLPTADGDNASTKDSYWMGTRELSEPELQALASNIVAQVRARGPFLSMADFVNRQLGSDETDDKVQRGALQQAIDDSALNSTVAIAATAGFEIQKADSEAEYDLADYQYKNITAGIGSSNQGAPGYLTQADILNVLGNAATVRSDTFTIRSYGEARDNSNKIVATAYCEATVQRTVDWVDSSSPPEDTENAQMIPANKEFGRRLKITSFRWLNPSEI